jgi:hypothetical protein
VLGWNPDAVYDEVRHGTRDEADEVVLDLKPDTGPNNPHTPIWAVDTDGSGVISVNDLRDIGTTMWSVNKLYDTKSSGSIDNLGQNVVSPDEIDIPSLIVRQPDRLPITELDDGDSIEIPVPVADDGTVEVSDGEHLMHQLAQQSQVLSANCWMVPIRYKQQPMLLTDRI